MKKLISILLSAAMLASISAYALGTDAELDAMPIAPENSPSDWAIAEVSEAEFKGIITDAVCADFQADITREQFCELVMKAYEKLAKPVEISEMPEFSDTENESVLMAAAIGIVNGYGDGVFAPNDKITREQIAAMLVRMLDKSDIGLDVNDYTETDFADKAQISEWALPSVNFLYANGILKGTAPDTVDPMSFTSCEQGILLTYRTYKKYEYYGKDTIAKTLLNDFMEKANDEAAALSLAEEIVKNPIIQFSPVALEMEEGYLQGFSGIEIKGFKEAAVFAPMVGTIPFIGYIFTLDDGADTDAFIKMLEESANLNWNICTTADEMLTAKKGNKVFFVMSTYGME